MFGWRRQIAVAGGDCSILILSVVPTPYDAAPSAPEPLLLVLYLSLVALTVRIFLLHFGALVSVAHVVVLALCAWSKKSLSRVSLWILSRRLICGACCHRSRFY